MVVSPQDLERLSEIDLERLKKVEAALDAKLQENYQAGSESIINLVLVAKLNGIEKLTYKMRTEILNRYKVAGWNVNIDPSQPDMIVFAGPIIHNSEGDAPNIPVEEMMAILEKKKKELGITKKTPPPNSAPFPKKSRNDSDNPYKEVKPKPTPGKFIR